MFHKGLLSDHYFLFRYTTPLEDIAVTHDIRCMMYADDMQLYLTFDTSNKQQALAKVSACMNDIISWSVSNHLFLNESKTEIIHFTSRFNRSTDIPSVPVG